MTVTTVFVPTLSGPASRDFPVIASMLDEIIGPRVTEREREALIIKTAFRFSGWDFVGQPMATAAEDVAIYILGKYCKSGITTLLEATSESTKEALKLWNSNRISAMNAYEVQIQAEPILRLFGMCENFNEWQVWELFMDLTKATQAFHNGQHDFTVYNGLPTLDSMDSLCLGEALVAHAKQRDFGTSLVMLFSLKKWAIKELN